MLEQRQRSAGLGPRDVVAPGSMRNQHRAVLLKLLWENREMSRAELARRTGLSRSTVSVIVNEILESGLVQELGSGSSSGGRKPILLGFRDNARSILGFDIGASHVGVVRTNLRCEVLGRRERFFLTREAPEETISLAFELADEVLPRAERGSLLGVGIGLPAPVQRGNSAALSATMPAWLEVDVAGRFSARMGCPTYIDNDANLGALGEQWWGAGKEFEDLVYVKVATGIGAGMILGGRIVHGSHGAAGELGHLSLDPNGPPCVCGVNGCLNVLIGTQALLQRAKARLNHFPHSILENTGLSLRALIDAANQDDPLALEIVGYAGERLGEGLATLMNVLDPSVLVLGGEITEVGERLLKPVRDTVLRRTLVASVAEPRVVRTQIDKQGIALGAATLVLRAALDTHELPLSRAVAMKETA